MNSRSQKVQRSPAKASGYSVLPAQTLDLFDSFDKPLRTRSREHGKTAPQTRSRSTESSGFRESSDAADRFLLQLTQSPDSELVATLASLEERRPGILRRSMEASGRGVALGRTERAPAAVPKGSVREVRRLLPEASAVAEPLLTRQRDSRSLDRAALSKPRVALAAMTGNEPLVQFSTFIYYCMEDEGHMQIDVMRLGDLSLPSAVSIRSVNRSAVAGMHYQAVRERVDFKAHEDVKPVYVPLIDSPEWDTTLEFILELHGEDEGLVNATLGRYLHRATIQIISTDTFPTNGYEALLESEPRDAQRLLVQRVHLFVEYLKFNWTSPIIRQRSMKAVMCDQLQNLYNFFHLFCQVYLVDFILGRSAPDSRLLFTHSKPLSLLLIVVCTIVPCSLLHFLEDRRAHSYGVGGTSRKRLQLSLLRKFLNYNTSSRSRISTGDLSMAMSRDSLMIASKGYSNAIFIIREMGELALMLVYQFAAPHVFGKKFSWLAFAPLVMFPILMAFFLNWRNELTHSWLEQKNKCQNASIALVDESVANYHLIADFCQREKINANFEASVKGFNHANNVSGSIMQNNIWFARWLGIITIVCWTFFGGMEVIHGDISLGMFLANITIFNKIGAAWGGIYKLLLQILTICPALENVTMAMNLPTDVPTRMALNRLRRQETAAMRKELHLKQEDHRLPLDIMPIVMNDISFTHLSMSPDGSRRSTTLDHRGSVSISQGELVFLMGPSGGGKTTLLKMIGGEILPDPDAMDRSLGKQSRLFVPSHLRVLHVSQPLFFEASMHANLTFGVAEDDSDASPERVASVCRQLGMTEDMLTHLEDNGCHCWRDVLSATQCQLLSVARALIANPEVLCIHQPTQVFNVAIALKVTQVLREFVSNQGVVQQQARNAHSRRPRTLIMTTARKSCLPFADQVFHITREQGIRFVGPAEYDSMEIV